MQCRVFANRKWSIVICNAGVPSEILSALSEQESREYALAYEKLNPGSFAQAFIPSQGLPDVLVRYLAQRKSESRPLGCVQGIPELLPSRTASEQLCPQHDVAGEDAMTELGSVLSI
jgi:hypothetical protein